MRKIFTTSKFLLANVVLAGLFLFAGSAQAQSFRILPGKVVKKDYAFKNIDGEEISAYIENVSTNSLRLKWERLSNNLDQLKWDYSLCDNVNCYPGVPDTATMGELQPNQQGVFKLAITVDPQTSTAGTGTVKMLIFNLDNPQDRDTVTFIANVGTSGINDVQKNDARLSIYPNPATDVINISSTELNTGSGNMSIYNATGAKVEDIKLNADAINSISVSQLPSGIYYIRYQGIAGEVATRSFIKK